jgi:hypothetical protein
VHLFSWIWHTLGDQRRGERGKSNLLERHDQQQGWVAPHSPIERNFTDRQKADLLIESPRHRVAIFDRTLIVRGGQRCHQQEAIAACLQLLPEALNELFPNALPSPICMNGHPGDLNGRGTVGLYRQKADDAAIGDSRPSLLCSYRLSTRLPATFVPKMAWESQNNLVTGRGISNSEWTYFQMGDVNGRHIFLLKIRVP